MASGSSGHTAIYWEGMINFYRLDTNLHEICIGNMDIYFSFKTPIAYRTKEHGLKICEGKKSDHVRIITVCNTKKAMFIDEEKFNWEIRDQFKRTIYDMAKQFTLERMGINVSKQRNTGKPRNKSAGSIKKRH